MAHATKTPQAHTSRTTYILGVRVDRLTQAEALSELSKFVHERRAQPEMVPCRQMVTVNPEFVMAAQKHHLFRQAINEAAMVVADGVGIVLACKWLRTPTPERVTGTDFMPALARLCAQHGYRLFLLGAAPGIAEQAATRLQEIAPGLQIAGTYAGSPSVEEEEEILARLQTAQADVLCVAYGAPAQELWIYRHLSRLPLAIAIGVGGAFDFLAGKQKRAPATMQRLGLEWLYRLYREPTRWRRMLALPKFATQVLLKGHGRP
jgi:N-acetylglucosaminyldiphosphoundecaprenol N-acetyl-beta-D-mannosaminyltransferase